VSRPIIGVTSYVEQARFGAWDVPAALIPLSYVQAIERAGGRALVVPPTEDGVEETLDALDGLLLSGGSDLDPSLYGADAHPETRNIRPGRDLAEMALLRAALARDLPVLAVCRGSQVLNVARGGNLVQHLPETLGNEAHRETPGVFSDHGVQVDPSSRLGGIVGTSVDVKSHHHQGYGDLGEGLRVVARAEDGTIEAVEDPERRFAVGVLWHPEAGEDAALFEALVSEARDHRATRASRTR
jgi:putative glutamine amidotransferase